MAKVYLDDDRVTPEGYHRTFTVEDTIDFIRANEGNIEIVSLDNDLGLGLREGYEVMNWIEEQAFNNTLQPIPHLFIHSGNSVAVDRMMMARKNAWQYWTNHGHDRSEFLTKDYN